MAIPEPTIPSAITPISSVELSTTQNNRAFYVYSGIISVDTSETTMVSINDIGKRDIMMCLEVGCEAFTTDNPTVIVKSNGQTIYSNTGTETTRAMTGYNEIKMILPANTSFEVILKFSGSAYNMTVAGYGYYL